MQYKTVAGPVVTHIASGKDFDDAIAQLADVINRECVGGWEFYNIYPVTVEKKAKGFGNVVKNAFALDMADGIYSAMMLVFRKE